MASLKPKKIRKIIGKPQNGYPAILKCNSGFGDSMEIPGNVAEFFLMHDASVSIIYQSGRTDIWKWDRRLKK